MSRVSPLPPHAAAVPLSPISGQAHFSWASLARLCTQCLCGTHTFCQQLPAPRASSDPAAVTAAARRAALRVLYAILTAPPAPDAAACVLCSTYFGPDAVAEASVARAVAAVEAATIPTAADDDGSHEKAAEAYSVAIASRSGAKRSLCGSPRRRYARFHAMSVVIEEKGMSPVSVLAKTRSLLLHTHGVARGHTRRSEGVAGRARNRSWCENVPTVGLRSVTMKTEPTPCNLSSPSARRESASASESPPW